jgi:outer membrane lipoprotein-sorting protein
MSVGRQRDIARPPQADPRGRHRSVRRRLRCLGGAALLFSVVPLASPRALEAQDDRALTLLVDAGARYRGIQSFCSDFQQVMEVPLLGQTTRSRGELCQAQPDLFAMRFSEPSGDVVLSDGAHFWVYYPSVDSVQVLQFSLETRPGGMDFQREFLEDPGEKYALSYLGEESLEGRPTHVIEARPRGAAAFTGARIWLDSERSLILRARIEMENGSVRTLTLSGIRLDPPPDPRRFRFDPPPGTQIIRRR